MGQKAGHWVEQGAEKVIEQGLQKNQKENKDQDAGLLATRDQETCGPKFALIKQICSDIIIQNKAFGPHFIDSLIVSRIIMNSYSLCIV